MIPMKVTKHMNVLYLSIKSCSCKKEISHFLFRNRSRIGEILLLNDERSYSASSPSLLSRRRLEIILLKLKSEQIERKKMKNAQKSHFKEFNIIYRTATFSNEAADSVSNKKNRNSIVIHIHLFITYWNFPIGIRSSSTAISSLVCSIIFMYFSIEVCIKFFPMKCRLGSAYNFL